VISFLVDEDFNNDVVRGLLRRVAQSLAVGQVIEDLLLIVQCSAPADWTHQVVYLPLR
jgi:hypothetical protein